MIQATDPLSSMFKATADAAERYAALTLEGTEGLFKCQLAVARELFAITEKQFAHWSSGNPPSMARMDWETVFRDNGEHAAELSRACAEAATRAQSEFARLAGEQMSVLNRMWLDNIQGITTAADVAGIARSEPFVHKHKKAA